MQIPREGFQTNGKALNLVWGLAPKRFPAIVIDYNLIRNIALDPLHELILDVNSIKYCCALLQGEVSSLNKKEVDDE